MMVRSGFALFGLGCWLVMVPACAWMHGGDSANPQSNPLPPSEMRPANQTASTQSRTDSPYHTAQGSPNVQTPERNTQRPVFNINDKPHPTDQAGDPSTRIPSTYPNTSTVPPVPATSEGDNELRAEFNPGHNVENRLRPSIFPPGAGTSQETQGSLPPPKPAAQTTDKNPQVIYPSQQADVKPKVEQQGQAKEPPLLAFLRLYLDKHPTEAVAQLNCYDKTRQDLLLGLLSLAVGLTEGDTTKIDPQQAEVIVSQLHSIASPFLPRAPLILNTACLAHTVRDFGQYEPDPPDKVYVPGSHVQIYVEMRNFSNVRNGTFNEIRLAACVDFYDAENHLIPNARVEFPGNEIPVAGRRDRREFSRDYSFGLPSLPPGTYKMRLQVVDVPTQRRAEKELTIRVNNSPRQS